MWYKIIFRKRQQAGRWAGTLSARSDAVQPGLGLHLASYVATMATTLARSKADKATTTLKAATLLTLCSQHKALGQQTCRQSPKLQNDFATLHWRHSEHKAWGRPAGWFTCGNNAQHDAQHIPRSDFASACIAADLVCLSRMMSAWTAVVWPSLFCVQPKSTLAH